jgi:hypothetical protein
MKKKVVAGVFGVMVVVLLAWSMTMNSRIKKRLLSVGQPCAAA